MRKVIYIVALFAVILSFASCENNINIYPVENNTADQFYSSEFEMNQAIIGVYARLGRNGTNTDFPTDYYLQASEGR